MIVTPPASASAHSRVRSDWHAWWMATSDAEQAVSTLTAGPCRPKVYAIRPETTLIAVPVARCPSMAGSAVSGTAMR
ncbi:MAG: hypothetical protein E6G35_16395 [Actinobacteria bacterium]|nr:MAG: hypothetical protein E6G35_16395 [Actinomycetota bacterium]